MGWLGIGFKLVPMVIEGVRTAEKIISGRNAGKRKEDAVIDLVRSMLHTGEAGRDREALNDPATLGAIRGLIAAIVHLLNVVSSRPSGSPS